MKPGQIWRIQGEHYLALQNQSGGISLNALKRLSATEFEPIFGGIVLASPQPPGAELVGTTKVVLTLVSEP